MSSSMEKSQRALAASLPDARFTAAQPASRAGAGHGRGTTTRRWQQEQWSGRAGALDEVAINRQNARS